MLLGSLLALNAVGCGDDKKKSAIDDYRPSKEVGGPDGGDNGGDNGSDSTGSVTGGTRVEVTDAPRCAADVANTPGIDCPGYVSCGGDLMSPHVCPTATHSCCVSGLPSEDTVNCYEGKTACRGPEARNPCDGPEDCTGGRVCCVTPPNAQVITECRAAADCDERSEGTVFCHTDADCPSGKLCAPPSIARWWGFCN